MYTVRGSFIDKARITREEFKLSDSNENAETSKLIQKDE